MRNKKFLRAFDSVDEKYIDEADPDAVFATAGKSKRLSAAAIRRIIVIAASLCLVTALSLVLFLPFNTENEIEQYEKDPYYKVIAALDAMDRRDDDPKNNFEIFAGIINGMLGGGIKGEVDYAQKDDLVSNSGNMEGVIMPEGDASNGNSALGNGKYEEATDNQVDGVIEADLIKRTDKYIFYLDRDYASATIRVYSIAGENSDKVATYSVSFWNEFSHVYASDSEFYLSQDANTITFIVHGHHNNDESESMFYTNKLYTEIISIDVSDVTNIHKKASVVLTGNYVSSRNTNGNLLLISRFTAAEKPDFSDESTFLPQIIIDGKATSVSPDDIVIPDVLDSKIYTVVTMLDVDDLSVKGNVAYLSFSNNHYVSEDTVYITRSYIGERTAGDVTYRGPVTEIVALGYDADGFEKKQGVTVEGRVKDQYSLDQHKGILRVVTTTETAAYREEKKDSGFIMREYVDRGESNAALWCIDLETMKVVASVEDFAPDGETVQSVRFDGDYAYVCTAVVVTFTDPVFFFDLSDLNNIIYKDTGDIKGYSSSLVDFGDGYLLGIGFGDNRNTLKIEIYVETENGVVSLCSYESVLTSFSQDYKSYYIDRENSLIGLGFYGYNEKMNNWATNYMILHFNGIDLVVMDCVNIDAQPDAMRGAYIDNYFYILGDSDFKVTKIFNAVK